MLPLEARAAPTLRFPAFRNLARGPFVPRLAALAILSPWTLGSALAVETVFWKASSPLEIERGTVDGLLAGESGNLALAPKLDALTGAIRGELAQPYFWSAALDDSGALIIGTGSEGRVLRIPPGGTPAVLATLPEPHVTALAIDPSGGIVAGTSPQGSIYRIGRQGEVSVLLNPAERYIWSLAYGRDGTLYAGTGERGRIYAVDPKGESRVFYDGVDPHFVSLAFDRQGNLLAGSDGSGLLLRLDSTGRARVILDSAQREISSISVDGAGNIYAASFAEGLPPAGPPELLLRFGAPAGGDEGMGPVSPRQGENPVNPAKGGTMTAVIEPSPSSSSAQVRPEGRGVLYRIAPDGTIDEVWSSDRVRIYSVAAAPDGSVWLGTGEPGAILRLARPREASVACRLTEAQVTSLLLDRSGRIYATASNAGAAYSLGPETSGTGTYTSRPLDGGFLSLWGRASWEEQTPKGSRIAIQTRTGSSPSPDASWSGWSPPLASSEGSPIESPPGRYLQWRAVLDDGGRGSPLLRDLLLTSRPRNRAPTIEAVSVPEAGSPPPAAQITIEAAGPSPPAGGAGAEAESGRTAPGERSASSESRWVLFDASDPDGDLLTFNLIARPAGPAGSGGKPEEREIPVAGDEGSPLQWDDSHLAEGRWRLTVKVSDDRTNPLGTDLSAEADSPPFVVDRTPPTLTPLPDDPSARGQIRIRASDSLSVIRRAEYSLDGSHWRAAGVADGVLDGKAEEIRVPEPAEGKKTTLRVQDAAGNESRIELPAVGASGRASGGGGGAR